MTWADRFGIRRAAMRVFGVGLACAAMGLSGCQKKEVTETTTRTTAEQPAVVQESAVTPREGLTTETSTGPHKAIPEPEPAGVTPTPGSN